MTEARTLYSIVPTRTHCEIAEELFVSVRIFECHAANIYAKIGARGRANTTAYALIHLI